MILAVLCFVLFFIVANMFFLTDLSMELNIMASKIEGKLGEIEAKQTELAAEQSAALARVAEDVAELRRLLAEGSDRDLSAEELAVFDRIQAGLDALKAALAGTDPVPEFPPAP